MRLNKVLRGQIHANAITATGIETELREANANRERIGLEIYAHLCGGADAVATLLKNEKKIRALLEKTPHIGAHFKINVRATLVLHFSDGERHDVHLSGELVPALADGYRSIDIKHPLAVEFKAADRLCDDIREEWTQRNNVLSAFLASFPNTEKLIAHWPEAAGFLPSDEKATGTSLMIIREDLNKLLGLKND